MLNALAFPRLTQHSLVLTYHSEQLTEEERRIPYHLTNLASCPHPYVRRFINNGISGPRAPPDFVLIHAKLRDNNHDPSLSLGPHFLR